jgi:RNA polymerase sigma factor (sigma-70 family)
MAVHTASGTHERRLPAADVEVAKQTPRGAMSTHETSSRDREQLVLDHDRLACALARKFNWCGDDAEDLQQVAREALVAAARRFDPAHGVRFSTYAYRVMWGRLMRHVRDSVRLIRHPRATHTMGGPYLLTLSLDALLGGEDSSLELEATLGALDPGFEAVEERLALRQTLAVLTREEKAALVVRARALAGRRAHRADGGSAGPAFAVHDLSVAPSRLRQKVA